MDTQFFDRPILNSPYEYPSRHWELDADGQPTNRLLERRRRAEFITAIPKARKVSRKKSAAVQEELGLGDAIGLSTATQKYDPTPIINELRGHVDTWRALPNPNQWHVTPETARLLQHWRHHKFSSIRPFFCQIEAVETLIWLTEVAPHIGKDGKKFLEHLTAANADANPGLTRLALKLATGAGNLIVIFGEPDIDILPVQGQPKQIQVKIDGVDVFHPNTGEVRSDGADGIDCWFIDTDYNEETCFVRHAYLLGANNPYKALKTTLKADTSRPFDKPKSGRIAVKVINHLGDEVMKVFRVDGKDH